MIEGDALATLRTLPDEHAQVCVVSPPYWQLRDYGVAGQLGMEPTPEEYVDTMVCVFREVRRVLRKSGTLWLNMGDSYAGQGGGNNGQHTGLNRWRAGGRTSRKGGSGLKPKDLVGMPWRLALALQADGWWLRSEIIWHKPSCVPESVRDRPTRAHEHVFLLSRSSRYLYDAAAIAEPVTGNAHGRGAGVNPKARVVTPSSWDTGEGAHKTIAHNSRSKATRKSRSRQNPSWSAAVSEPVTERNSRTVWTIPSEPLKDEHFAAFPSELARRCILAGSKRDDLVLDPFAGAGTTGLAAGQLGRSFLGIELHPEYVRLARRRCCGPLFEREVATA